MSILQVQEFHLAFGVPMSQTLTARVPAAALRYELIREELEELSDAIRDLDIVEIADALGDIQYVTHGAILVFGAQTSSLPERWTPLTFSVLHSTDREDLLGELKYAILTDDTDRLQIVLHSILTAVESAARYFKIDLEAVVDAIHKSNMSKLGEDGKPIYREGDRKVMKGPNYKTPTDDIRKLVFGDNYAPAGE